MQTNFGYLWQTKYGLRVYSYIFEEKKCQFADCRTSKPISSHPSFVFSSVQYCAVSTFTTSTICIISTHKSSKSLPLAQAPSMCTYEAGRMIPGILFSGSPGNMRREPPLGREWTGARYNIGINYITLRVIGKPL